MIFTKLRTIIIVTLVSLLIVSSGAMKLMLSKNQSLSEELQHYEVKEEADVFRAQPVVRDKSHILDRM